MATEPPRRSTLLDEAIALSTVVVVGLLVLVWAQEDLRPREARWFWWSVLAHLVAVVLFTGLQRSSPIEVSDMRRYLHYGHLLGEDLRRDFWGVFPHTVATLLHQPSGLHAYIPGKGPAGTMTILISWLSLVLGPRLWATNAVFMFLSLLGKLALYTGLRRGFPESLRPRLAMAVFVVPSLVFWTSGVVKEAVAMVGMGMAILALSRLVERFGWLEALRLVIGVAAMGLVKPYILFVFAGSTGVWLYYRWATRRGGIVRFRPVALVSITAMAVGALVGLGLLFPHFALDQLGEQAALRQEFAFRTEARSAYVLGAPGQASLFRSVVLAPMGVFTAWYRPLLTEAHTPMAMLSALECTVMLVLSGLCVARLDASNLWASLSRWPWLAFGMVFAVTLGFAVGLVTSNLGTMVRYRVPLLPFLALALAVWSLPRDTLRRLIDEPPGPLDHDEEAPTRRVSAARTAAARPPA